MHNPSVRVPSKHDELVTQVKLDTAVFVQDVPESIAAEQSPTVSALASNSDASQFAKRSNVRKVQTPISSEMKKSHSTTRVSNTCAQSRAENAIKAG
jgi:hypothetical protein